jgi:hypothetical protein
MKCVRACIKTLVGKQQTESRFDIHLQSFLLENHRACCETHRHCFHCHTVITVIPSMHGLHLCV